MKTTIRSFLYATFLAGALVMGVPQPVFGEEGPGWQQVYAREGECVIFFPSSPERVQQSMPLPEGKKLHYEVYLAPFEAKGICMLLIATYPSALPAGQESAGLAGLVRGILGNNPENQLVFAEVVNIQGFPAVNFMIRSGTNYFRGVATMVGSKLFLVGMEGRAHEYQEKVFQKYFTSFKLLGI